MILFEVGVYYTERGFPHKVNLKIVCSGVENAIKFAKGWFDEFQFEDIRIEKVESKGNIHYIESAE